QSDRAGGARRGPTARHHRGDPRTAPGLRGRGDAGSPGPRSPAPALARGRCARRRSRPPARSATHGLGWERAMSRAHSSTFAAIAGLAGRAMADPPRPHVLALVIANNHSASGRPELRYADDDAANYDELFRMLTDDDAVELVTELDRDSAELYPDAVRRSHAPT